MNEKAKITEFIDWAIANIEAIANIKSVPLEDVYDAIAALSKLLPQSYTVEVQKEYSCVDNEEYPDLIVVSGWLPIGEAADEEEAIAMVDRMIARGLEINDSRIAWSEDVKDGWIYEDFSFSTTGETDD